MIYECEPASNMMIAVASHTYWVAADTMSSIVSGVFALLSNRIGAKLITVCGHAHMDHVCNVIATRFLMSECSDLLIVDYDVVTPPESYLRIAKARRPIIGGSYPKKTEEEEFTVDFGDRPLIPDEDGFFKPEVLPTGFLRINREVFSILPHKDYWDKNERIHGYFGAYVDDVFVGTFIDPKSERHIGQDNCFVGNWLGMGGEIYMIPDLDFVHWGMKAWRGNWLEFAMRSGVVNVK